MEEQPKTYHFSIDLMEVPENTRELFTLIANQCSQFTIHYRELNELADQHASDLNQLQHIRFLSNPITYSEFDLKEASLVSYLNGSATGIIVTMDAIRFHVPLQRFLDQKPDLRRVLNHIRDQAKHWMSISDSY